MHTVPGALEKLMRLYREGEGASLAGDYATAVAKFTEGIAIDDHFRRRSITMYAERAFALHRLDRFAEAVAD